MGPGGRFGPDLGPASLFESVFRSFNSVFSLGVLKFLPKSWPPFTGALPQTPPGTPRTPWRTYRTYLKLAAGDVSLLAVLKLP